MHCRRAKFCCGCANFTHAGYPSPFPHSICHLPRSLPQCNALNTDVRTHLRQRMSPSLGTVHARPSLGARTAPACGLCCLVSFGVSVPALVTSAQCAVDGRPRTVASVHETESRHRPFLSTPTHAQARTHGPGPVDMWASINSPMIAQSRSSRPNFVTAVLGNCLTAIKG